MPKQARPKKETDKRLAIQIFTRVDAATNAAIENAATKLDRPPAWIIRKAVEEWLSRNAAKG